MNRFNIFILAIAALVCLVAGSLDGISLTKGVESTVRQLDDSNFEHDTQASTGSTTGDWFVMFYMPGCGHCTRAIPEVEALASKYEEHSVNIAKVDCSGAGEWTCRRFAVRGVPQFTLIRKGQMFKYDAKRSADVMEAWLNRVDLEGGSAIPAELDFKAKLMFYLSFDWKDVMIVYEEYPILVYSTGAAFAILVLLILYMVMIPQPVNYVTPDGKPIPREQAERMLAAKKKGNKAE